MKVLKKGKLSVEWTCPHCGSVLLVEKGDVHWYKDYGGGSDPYITCCECGKSTDVSYDEKIQKLL